MNVGANLQIIQYTIDVLNKQKFYRNKHFCFSLWFFTLFIIPLSPDMYKLSDFLTSVLGMPPDDVVSEEL